MNALVTKADRDVLVTATSEATSLMEVITRAARDPSVDVVKLERLMEMYERIESRKAEIEFNAAMSAAQSEMRPVAKDSDNPQTHSKYASYYALDQAVRPTYSQHGFSLSYNTAAAALPTDIRVICYVARGGYVREYHIDMPADGKGAKGGDVMTRTHATGSAVQYGKRYLLGMIFNIAVTKDDDGNAAGHRPTPPRKPERPRLSEEQVARLRQLLGTQENETAFLKAMGPGLDSLGGFYYDRFGKALELVAEFMARQTPGKPADAFQPKGEGYMPPKFKGSSTGNLEDVDPDTGEVTAPPRPTQRPKPPRPVATSDAPDFATASLPELQEWARYCFSKAQNEDEANEIWDKEFLYQLKKTFPPNVDILYGEWLQMMERLR